MHAPLTETWNALTVVSVFGRFTLFSYRAILFIMNVMDLKITFFMLLATAPESCSTYIDVGVRELRGGMLLVL